MNAVVLDTNTLRGLSPSAFAALTAAEAAHNVRPYADVWTILELLAHLHDSQDPSYWPSRRALRRCAERALLPREEPARLIAPAELQICRLIFDDISDVDEANVAAHILLAQMVARADDSDDLAQIQSQLATIADHVADKEAWFVEYFDTFRREAIASAVDLTVQERNFVIRSHLRSEELRRQDALAVIHRAYDQRGIDRPSLITEELLATVQNALNASSQSLSVVLERIVCDNAGLHHSHIRNLIWDQEVAGSIGQAIDGMPVLLVTNDKFFAEAAARAGHREAVNTLAEYAEALGISIDAAA